MLGILEPRQHWVRAQSSQLLFLAEEDGRVSMVLGGRGGKWDVRVVAAERLYLITSSPAVVFFYTK